MAGKKGQKKRFWSDDEKRSICEQTLAPEVSVAQVARRYSMNPNLIFKWLKDPRFAPCPKETNEGPDDGGGFLPVEIAGPTIDHEPAKAETAVPITSATALLAQRVDITLSDERRIIVEGPTELSENDGHARPAQPRVMRRLPRGLPQPRKLCLVLRVVPDLTSSSSQFETKGEGFSPE